MGKSWRSIWIRQPPPDTCTASKFERTTSLSLSLVSIQTEVNNIPSRRTDKTTWIILCSSLLFVAALLYLLPLRPIDISRFTRTPSNPDPSNMDWSCPTNHYDTTKRTIFSHRGVMVYGWPSAGGVLIKEFASIVDMNFLGIDRLHVSRRSKSQDEEDAFCDKLRKTGAKCWEDEESFIEVSLGARDSREEERELVLGWPSQDAGGGVWVLMYSTQDAIPRDIGRVNLAMDMDEKCAVMKEFGATFYEDPAQVAHLWNEKQ